MANSAVPGRLEPTTPHGFAGADHEVRKVGGFFQRVGAGGDHDAVRIGLLDTRRDAFAEHHQGFVVNTLRSDLRHLLTAHIRRIAQFGQTRQ